MIPRLFVYTADVAPLRDPQTYDALYRCASSARRLKTDRLKFEKDRWLSLGAEYLLMCACAEFGLDYAHLTVNIGENSKPYFANSPVHFNLSHSGTRVLCAISDRDVGCDIEAVRPIEPDIAKRFFHEDEYAAIAQCGSPSEQENLFFRFWTLKESYMKCTGLGFALPMNAFSIVLVSGAPMLASSPQSGNFKLFECETTDRYKIACCVKDMSSPFEHRFVERKVVFP